MLVFIRLQTCKHPSNKGITLRCRLRGCWWWLLLLPEETLLPLLPPLWLLPPLRPGRKACSTKVSSFCSARNSGIDSQPHQIFANDWTRGREHVHSVRVADVLGKGGILAIADFMHCQRNSCAPSNALRGFILPES
jgi:hypothetical protein